MSTEPPAEPEPVLMTMRVTRFTGGEIVEQRPEVQITAAEPLDPYSLTSAWPPCQCPRHRGGG